MSFFGKMFGGKKEVAPTTGEAIQKLRETENMLLKKQDFLEKKIELELDTARKNGTKNKRGKGATKKKLSNKIDKNKIDRRQVRLVGRNTKCKTKAFMFCIMFWNVNNTKLNFLLATRV